MSKYKDFSDLELLIRISKYDSRALEEVYNRYSKLVYTLIKNIVKDVKESETLLVETFTHVWRYAGKIKFNSTSAYTWLMLLARNVAVVYIRKKRNDSEESIPKDPEKFIVPKLADDIDNIDLVTAKNISPKMDRAIYSMTESQNYVLKLAFYEGYNLNEIADKLNIPVETVRSKIMTALHNLRENLLSGDENE